jgi:citrate lyase synthetase
MIIRRLRREDMHRIDEIYKSHHQDDFSLPSLINTITSAVVTDDLGELIGFGAVKILAEAIMVLDLDRPKNDRLEAMQLLMDEAIRACHKRGITQLHVFVKKEEMQRLLQRKFGFNIVTDQAMVLEVKYG